MYLIFLFIIFAFGSYIYIFISGLKNGTKMVISIKMVGTGKGGNV